MPAESVAPSVRARRPAQDPGAGRGAHHARGGPVPGRARQTLHDRRAVRLHAETPRDRLRPGGCSLVSRGLDAVLG